MKLKNINIFVWIVMLFFTNLWVRSWRQLWRLYKYSIPAIFSSYELMEKPCFILFYWKVYFGVCYYVRVYVTITNKREENLSKPFRSEDGNRRYLAFKYLMSLWAHTAPILYFGDFLNKKLKQIKCFYWIYS